jgi:uncharacterized membrane protein
MQRMHARIRHWIEEVRTGFWFVPIVMLLASSVLALALLYLDGHLDPGVKSTLRWAYSGGPDGARSLLSTIAGSMITAASVTFSLASVALSISSQQYGSRVLRNFMRDSITQFLLGTFLSTFIYSVLVVRTIRGSDYGGGFVPAISVTVAIILALASLVLLVFFIHHISTSIQASRIIEVISNNIKANIPHLYPLGAGMPFSDSSRVERDFTGPQLTVGMVDSGYVQSIDLSTLLSIASETHLILEVLVQPGDPLVQGDPVVRAWGAAELTESITHRILRSFLLGGDRTDEQDIRYRFQQMTDVIVRALSPGINDPFTAINGTDELARNLQLMARHAPRHGNLQDKTGELRVVAPLTNMSELLHQTVGHIAIYAAKDAFVMDGLRRILNVVERDAHEEESVAAIARLRSELDRRQQAEVV